MILHKDGLIELKFETASGILTVRWPNSNSTTTAELVYSFRLLIDTIQSYNVRNLLIDAQEDVSNVTDEDYVELNVNLAKALAHTQLKKVARLGSANTNRENFIEKLAEDTLADPATVVAYQNFQDERVAWQWLLQE